MGRRHPFPVSRGSTKEQGSHHLHSRDKSGPSRGQGKPNVEGEVLKHIMISCQNTISQCQRTVVRAQGKRKVIENSWNGNATADSRTLMDGAERRDGWVMIFRRDHYPQSP